MSDLINYYNKIKDEIDSDCYDDNEMSRCIYVNGEIDSSVSMQEIKEAISDGFILDSLRNEYGEIDTQKILSLSRDYTSEVFISEIKDIVEIANNNLDKNDSAKIYNSLNSLTNIYFKTDNLDNASDDIDIYLEKIKGTFDGKIDCDLEKIIDTDIDNLKILINDNSLDSNLNFNNDLNEKQRELFEENEIKNGEERQKIIDEKNELDAKRAEEREFKILEKVNEFEHNVAKTIFGPLVPDNDKNDDNGFEI